MEESQAYKCFNTLCHAIFTVNTVDESILCHYKCVAEQVLTNGHETFTGGWHQHNSNEHQLLPSGMVVQTARAKEANLSQKQMFALTCIRTSTSIIGLGPRHVFLM